MFYLIAELLYVWYKRVIDFEYEVQDPLGPTVNYYDTSGDRTPDPKMMSHVLML